MRNDTITVIVPTYNRPASLDRILHYYTSYPYDVRIIVADSSSDDTLRENAKTISNLDGNVNHQTFSVGLPVRKKIADVLENVHTDYTVINADDDFIIPNGIETAVKFLEQNSSFSSAHGNYVYFDAKETTSGVTFNWSPLYVESRTLSQSNPKDRLLTHHSEITSTFYAVHRTSSVREAFKSTVIAADDVRFGELLPSMITVINGKFKHLNVFYGARYGAQQTGSTADNFTDFIQKRTFTAKYGNYLEALGKHLHARSELTQETSFTAVDDGMISYLVNSHGLTQGEAISLIEKEKIPRRLAEASPGSSTKSPSLPEKIRDWLQTTSVPRWTIPILENVYYVQYLIRRGDFRRAGFYIQLDRRMNKSTQEISMIRQFVQSYPEALNE